MRHAPESRRGVRNEQCELEFCQLDWCKMILNCASCCSMPQSLRDTPVTNVWLVSGSSSIVSRTMGIRAYKQTSPIRWTLRHRRPDPSTSPTLGFTLYGPDRIYTINHPTPPLPPLHCDPTRLLSTKRLGLRGKLSSKVLQHGPLCVIPKCPTEPNRPLLPARPRLAGWILQRRRSRYCHKPTLHPQWRSSMASERRKITRVTSGRASCPGRRGRLSER